MKNNALFRTNRLLIKVLLLGVISFLLRGFNPLPAQVTFTQTLNADFNKGVINNVVVSGDNVYLQNSASDVGSWLTTTVLPQTLAGHRTVSWNDRYAYVVGGYNNLNYVNTVYVAAITSGGISNWTALNPLPVALRDPAVAIGTNTIYVMGGRDGSQVYNTIYYAAINTDGTIGAWQTSAVTLPANLWGHTATYLMGNIYVIGGSSSMTENTALNTVYYAKVNALNTLSSFTAGTNLAVARNRHSTVTYNNKLYVMGGYDNSGTKSSSVYIATPALNGSTGAWSSGTSMPVALSNHSAAVTNGVISVLAGAVGATLSNTVYYANADAGSLTWSTSPNVMYDFTKDGSAFTGNGMVFYTGGSNLSGTPIFNCRYSNLTLTANYVNHGVFVSNPFYELGAERLINSLIFNKAYTAPANLQVSYRTAANNGIWSDWTALVTASPITINLTKRYLQYAIIFTGSTTFNSTLNDMTLTTPGTELSGNLNATVTFTAALSPYWATSDISFTAGTHTFQAGAQVLFLPNTGLTVSQANIICNGTAVDSVRFTYFTNEVGQWDGIYFDDNSDNGVSSQFYYTVISSAGYGSNNANLYCYNTNEPLLSRCSIRNSDGNGIRLNTAHINIQNSVIKGNTENGLYLNLSNPTLTSTSVSYNTGAGIYLTGTLSNPNFSSTTIDHNMYAFRYPTPNLTFYQPNGSPTLTANTYNGLCVDGGDIDANQRWNTITYDYILLGTVQIGKYASYSRLTIEPGTTIKSLAGVQLQIGIPSSYGGELYALGTADSLITFTAHNGLAGGWNGIYFTDWSDNWGGAQSQLDYCVIEKGNDYNYYSVNTGQPNLINHTIIRNGLLDGARYSNATGSITSCQFLTNGRYPLYFLNPEANPVHTGNTYTGNIINRIALSGGNYSFNRTYNLDGGTAYYALDNIIMAQYAGTCRLTIDPGVIMDFAAGKKLQLGFTSSYGGELYAMGTIGSVITFRPYNLTAGGWEGIYFTQWNDNWGGVSTMQYCKVRLGNAQNILIEGSNQPSIDNCNIRESAGVGISLSQSGCSITNTAFSLNSGYPLKFNDWTCSTYLRNNTYTSNTPNYIALSGGTYDGSRTVYFDGAPYHVLGDIIMAQYAGHSRLTVQPGVTMNFNPGVKIQLGWPSSYGGDLWADGKADSLITFKPYNNLAGGWAGINFTDWNDTWGGTSLLKYCNIEKGDLYNINCVNSTQPTLDHSTLTQSTGNGLVISSSTPTIRNSTLKYNTGYGILMDGSSSDVTIGNTSAYTCNILDNYGAYDLYNNSAANINARYNFWGSGDSTMAGLRIYDKSDNSSKGRVYIGPFAQVPSILSATTVMSGTVKYANVGTNPMKNAAMVVKDFTGTTINSTTTNTSGVYTFPSMASGNYRMTITPSNPWNGGNSTDALNILRHFAQIEPLVGMKLAAADVNASHSVNGTDALLVMERWAGMISSFPAGDYLYHYDTVIMNGSNVTGNIDMICFGDVDASFAPVKKSSSSVGLIYEGSVLVDSFMEFDFPVRLKTGMQLGAISLGFMYPKDYLEITGAQLANGANGFSWTATDGLFKMGWCDMNALNISNDETVVILKMKTRDLSGLTTGISLDIFQDSEFADGSATPNELAVVSIPVINTELTGINPGSSRTGLSVYPNPVSENSTVVFSLKDPGSVRVSLINLVGTRVIEIANGTLSAGDHRIALKAAGLKPGIYLLKIEITNTGQTISEMIKLVVSY